MPSRPIRVDHDAAALDAIAGTAQGVRCDARPVDFQLMSPAGLDNLRVPACDALFDRKLYRCRRAAADREDRRIRPQLQDDSGKDGP